MQIEKGYKKHFNKIPLRKLTILDEKFLWKRGHLHLEKSKVSNNESVCVEKVVIYLENFTKAPLILFFKENDNHLLPNLKKDEKWCVGYPEQGVIWLSQPPYPNNKPVITINLNRPKVISELITYFRNNFWEPKLNKQQFVVENALKLLMVINLSKGVN